MLHVDGNWWNHQNRVSVLAVAFAPMALSHFHKDGEKKRKGECWGAQLLPNHWRLHIHEIESSQACCANGAGVITAEKCDYLYVFSLINRSAICLKREFDSRG